MISAAPLIRAIVAIHAPAAALLGERVFQDEAPQGVEFPCATFTCVFDDPQNHLRGRSELKRQRWQLDVWAQSPGEADQVATEVQAALARRDAGGVAVWLEESTIVFDFANQRYRRLAPYSVVMNETRPGHDRDSGLSRFMLDFTLWFYS